MSDNQTRTEVPGGMVTRVLKALRGSVHVRTFLQSSCEMFTQQLFLNSGNQRFSGGGVGAEEKLMLQIGACHVTSNCEGTTGTHCVLWSRYVMTLSASSSSRLLT